MRITGFIALPILIILALGAVSTSVYILSKSNLPTISSRPIPTTVIQPSAGINPQPSPSTITKIGLSPTPTLPYKIEDKNTITWEEAQNLIKNCQVKAVSQTHQLNVFLVLKDGKRVQTVEPQIDNISTEVKAAEAICGPIAEATE